MKIRSLAAALAASAVAAASAAHATDLEVTHWWTSGGEAAAVAEFAKAFDATGNKWVDGAIAGSGGTARPIMISRITGGDPMGATQFNHGRQAEELVEAGLMRDLTDSPTAENWADVVAAPRCSRAARSTARSTACRSTSTPGSGSGCRTRRSRTPASRSRPTGTSSSPPAPKLREAGKIPLAIGGQAWQNVRRLQRPHDRPRRQGPAQQGLRRQGRRGRRPGPRWRRSSQAADDAREMAKGTNVQDWNQATNMVITDKAGGQIMGDWAQGEFQVAGEVAGTDYTCLPGLGVNEIIATDGDAFYFPLLDDEEKSKAQEVLASVMFSPETQVAFNLKKGSLPIRQRRRPRRRQRLHEEGPRDPQGGQHRPGDDAADQPRHQHADRTTC